MNTETKKLLSIALIVFLGMVLFAKVSSANIFQDFLNSIRGTSTPTNTSQPVQLYKPVADYENAVVNAVKKASPAVVAITISKNMPVLKNCSQSFLDIPPEFRQFFGDIPQNTVPCDTGKTQLQEIGGGSGFIIASDGLILTNKHVVADTKASYTVLTNDGKQYNATVLARDPVQDLALVKISASNLPTVTLGDSSGLQLGQTAIAIGNALAEYRNTVSVGVVSGLSRTVTAAGQGTTERLEGVIQTDAAINPGNSGGPLLNLNGEVIGIDTAMASDAQNIGFAIPINVAKRDIDSVKTTGEIQAPFVGVRYTVITPDLATQNKLPVTSGVLVAGGQDGPAVVPGSPADKAGIKAGDIITAVNGKQLTQDFSLSSAVNAYKVGDTITLVVIRNGKNMSVQLTLAKRPAS